MSTALAKAPGTAVATTGGDTVGNNPFTRLGAALRPKNIFGQLLKFKKGKWLAGETDMSKTQFVALVDKLASGWVRWQDKRPTDHIMYDVMNGEVPPPRTDLGRDDDKSKWPVDKQGKRVDPWQFTMYLPLIAKDDGAAYTFAANSKGGRDACAELATNHGNRDGWDTDYPVIRLRHSSYEHDDYGTVITPELPIVSTVKRVTVAAAIAKALNATPEDDDDFGRSENPGHGMDDFDDEIPF